ncbi:MAG: hypothetical protein U0163_04985 [Gemmatimonadaceae bacterium]
MSWAISLPSVPMSLILGRVFGRIMIPVPDAYLPEGLGAVMWLVLACAVSLVASALPASLRPDGSGIGGAIVANPMPSLVSRQAIAQPQVISREAPECGAAS